MVHEPPAPAPPEPPPGVDDEFGKWNEDDVPCTVNSSTTTSTALDRIGSRLLAAASRDGIVIATPAANGRHGAATAAVAWSTPVDGVKKKRGRPRKGGDVNGVGGVAAAAPVAKKIKKEDEDVCFICFDGGSLVLCDRKDCPKAYHPACVKRDESFFKRRLRWNCGWHLCNICQKNAVFMCYTCPYSLCKACAKQAEIFCVRGNKGFCKNCMTTVSLIENIITEASKDMGHVDFDDIYSWEYLFKVYWVLLKQNECFTIEELTQATNPWKGQMSDQKNVYSSKVCDVTVSRTTDVAASTTADAAACRTADAAASRNVDAAACRNADAAASRNADAATARTVDAATARTVDVAASRTADAAASRTADAAAASRTADAAAVRTTDADDGRTADSSVTRTPDAAVSRTPDAAVTGTPDAIGKRTPDWSCSTIQSTLNEGHLELNVSKRRKTRKQSSVQIKSQEKIIHNQHYTIADWASEELLEFVAHMKNGDTSEMSQSDVQALLLEYIKKNNLRDPLRKSHIICDKRLEGLFEKNRVGHFEMLGLLERHFKEDSHPNGMVLGAAAETSSSQLENEWHGNETLSNNRQKKRPGRKRGDERATARQININLDSYAAVDMHNVSLIYLKRSLMETLLDVADKFHDNVVGSVVRIRIHGNDLKQDMYRLVSVVGTSKAAEPYKIGEKSTCMMLKILNLDKIEDVSIDVISNQDFSEDECRRLRQSMKCGLTGRMTVGEVQQKATALQAFRIHDILQAEILKLNHLRDRASEMGHRKELRECFEKLEVLRSPEERQRRLQNIPEVHVDSRMDPSCHSDDASEQPDTNKQASCSAPKYVSSNSMPLELNTPQRGDTPYSARAKVLRSSSTLKETMIIRTLPSKEDTPSKSCESTPSSLEHAARILEELSKQVDPSRFSKQEPETSANNPSPQIASSDASVTSSSTGTVLSCEYSELEKLWHYQDPAGNIQGPFCMLQLRKWNSSGYFPSDLRVWKVNESLHSSVFLNDALSVHCHNSDYHFQCGNICVGSQDAKVTSDGRKPEHDVQMSSTMNSELKDHERNDGCDSGMTEEAACSGDKVQCETEGNNVRGDVQCSQISFQENQKSPNGETSLSKAEVGDTSLVSSTTEPFTELGPPSRNDKDSNAPVSPSKDGNEDLSSSKIESEKVSALASSVKNSADSCWSVSSTQPQPEGKDSKGGEAEHKGDNGDLKHEATRDKEPLEKSAAPDQTLTSNWDGSASHGRSEFNMLNQTQPLDDKDEEESQTKTKEGEAEHKGDNEDLKHELTTDKESLENSAAPDQFLTSGQDGSPCHSKSEFNMPNQRQGMDDEDEEDSRDSGMASWDDAPGQSRSEFSHLPDQTQQLDVRNKSFQAGVKAIMDLNLAGKDSGMTSCDGTSSQGISEFSNLPDQTMQLDDEEENSQTDARATIALNASEQGPGMRSEFSNLPKLTQVPNYKDKDSPAEAKTTMALNLPGQAPDIANCDGPGVESRSEFSDLPNQIQLEGGDNNSHSAARATMALNLPGQDPSRSSWVGSAGQNIIEFSNLPKQIQVQNDEEKDAREWKTTMALNLFGLDSDISNCDGPAVESRSEFPNLLKHKKVEDKDNNSHSEAAPTMASNLPRQGSRTSNWDGASVQSGSEFPKLANQTQELDDKEYSLMEASATEVLNLSRQDLGLCSGDELAGLSRSEFSNLPNQTQGLDGKVKHSETEVKATVALNLPVQDSGPTCWDALTNEMNFSSIPENEGNKVDMSIGHSGTSVLPSHAMGVSWSTASSLVLDEPVNVSSEWAGYSQMHTKPSEELGNGLGTIPSIFDELFDGPIEFDTLGDQSVSDLLSEVEAMEMNGGMMPSPNNDCFSPLAGLSPPIEGGKSDSWSSSCDIQFHSDPNAMGETQHHYTVFGLDLNDCSTRPTNHCSSSTPPCTAGGEMKLDLGSSHPSRGFPSQHHRTSLPLPNLNLVSSCGGLGFEDVKPDYVHLNLQDLVSQGFSTPSLALSTGVGPTINSVPVGEMKPVVSMSRCDFVSQGQILPSCVGSGDISHRSRAVKTEVNPTCMNKERLMAPVDLHCPTKYSPSRSLPIVSKPVTSTPLQGGEMNLVGASRAESSYPPPSSQQALPSMSQIDLSRLPSPPQRSPNLSAPSSPSRSRDISSSSVEEGEVEPIADLLGIKEASSPIEEGEVKSSPLLSNRKKEEHPTARSNPPPSTSSSRVPPLKPPALDVSMSGRMPTKEKSSFSPPGSSPRNSSSFSPPGSSPRNGKSTSWMTGQGNSLMAMTTGNPRDGGSNHQGVIRGSNPLRYQSVLGRPSGPKDRSHHPHPYQLPIVVSPGFVKPSRQSWGRQASFGSGGIGGSPRQQTPGHGRGQRVCKFYERGCCRKGASCNYLHPS